MPTSKFSRTAPRCRGRRRAQYRVRAGHARASRAGYSMMEMLAVVVTLAALAGLAWPTLRHALGKSQLREAANAVRTEMANARLTAIETGVPQQFCYQPGTGHYLISPAGLSPEAEDATASPQSTRDFARHSQPHAEAGPHECIVHCLADGVRFCDPKEPLADHDADWGDHVDRNLASDAGQLALDEPLEESAAWSVPIVFYPSGRALDAVVRLVGERNFQVAVSLKGVSGVIDVDAPQRESRVMR